ncbi:MAG TPA: hypothetical protein VFH61_17990 [Thermoleophilia bacterium]|nr:hypothetical protein [Thermoleophilia bacterium]
MTLTLTIEALRVRSACDLYKRVEELREALPDVADDTPVPLSAWWSLPSTSLDDRFWSLRAVEPFIEAHRLGVRAAALAARRVLHRIRDEAHRATAQRALEAAEAWAENPSDADAASAASAVANVTYAAASAERAAVLASYAASHASYAIYDSAASAERAASDHYSERALQRADLDRLLQELT